MDQRRQAGLAVLMSGLFAACAVPAALAGSAGAGPRDIVLSLPWHQPTFFLQQAPSQAASQPMNRPGARAAQQRMQAARDAERQRMTRGGLLIAGIGALLLSRYLRTRRRGH